MHPANSLPLLTDDFIHLKDYIDDKTSKSIQIIRYDFKRLPKPYDTQCYEYPANETQFHCLNECYEKAYEKRFHCIPKYNSLLTIQLFNDYIEPNITFCEHYNINNKTDINRYLIKSCNIKCPSPCRGSLFLSNILDTIDDFNFNLYHNYYNLVKYTEAITFIDLIIKMANILSLWHGISFIGVLNKFLNIINHNITNCTRHKCRQIVAALLNNFKKHMLKVCINIFITDKKYIYKQTEPKLNDILFTARIHRNINGFTYATVIRHINALL